ncbi:MAG TPA: hypothetical protein VGP47_09585 [Parachlamydiaceae bacterium]|nr:hypothetical protein [Parachlamydiaceae bacterium]
MHITTIFGTSITLAAGILLGWTFSNVNPFPSIIPPQSTLAYHPTPEVHPPLPIASLPEINLDLQQAERLIISARPIEALAILSGISPTIDLSSLDGKEWLRLLVDAYAATDNQNQLILLYNQFPEALEANEHASLAIADSLIEANNTLKYNILRSQWRGREKEETRWIFLDAQAKILEGNNNEAAQLLEANHFRGKDETDRLVRLAALYIIDDPQRAWKYLSEATQNDPKNPDLRTFKASLGESLKHDQIANADYIVAVQYDPENPYRREQLADYYLRSRQYPQALEILEDTMSAPSLDSIWLKTIFWSHMAVPHTETWNQQDIPQGTLRDLVSYVLALPAGITWDQRAFAMIPDHELYLNTRQETFWLQLFSALKSGEEENALKLIDNNIFHYVSWAPDLENGLKTLLNYRLLQKANPGKGLSSIIANGSEVENPQQLLQLLSSLSDAPAEQLSSAIPYHLQDFLLGKEAFTMPFYAIGWTEAALQLHSMEKLPDTVPGWVAEATTKAINQNRDSKAALAFAMNQKSTPALSLLIAEIALASDEKQIAFNALKSIYTTNDVSGQKAALMLGQFLVEHNNLPDAKKALLTHPSLSNETPAKEILARIAMQEGDLNKAYMLYLDIEKNSSEAKSFLAKKAFAEKDWPRARQLTEALLKEHPENPTLTDNLHRIIAEAKKKRTTK